MATFYSLCILGLRPESNLLDIGCGCLRNGFLLMNYLDPKRYFGVEPNVGMLDEGIQKLARPFVEAKSPSFAHTDTFDFAGSFPGVTFDFVLARSIFTHTSKLQMEMCFEQLEKVTAPGAIFLLSYYPPRKLLGSEYKGKDWVGRSHESDRPGIAHYKKETILDRAGQHGFTEVPGFEDRILQALQEWLVLRRVR
jgi:cyclopropane fatty-acyl-phospholipid synthase-like methyltransferase